MKNNKSYKFVVVGAGPSGILAISTLLLIHKVAFSDILWIDPNFGGGDFVLNWSNIPSNTKVKYFINFLEDCYSYDVELFSKKFMLFKLNPENTCYLRYMIEPLHWVTSSILCKVDHFRGMVQSISKGEDIWLLNLSNKVVVEAKNVILAHGSEPIKLSYENLQEISLEIALDKDKLKNHCRKRDRIAIIGSSHSAVLVLKNLFEINQFSQLINFYKSPLRYASYHENGSIFFDNTGLKGDAALFASQYLEKIMNEKIVRMLYTTENIDKYLPTCTKIIYAIGFKRRKMKISGINIDQYDEKTGIIANGLYGIGIAFPSHIKNHLDEIEKNVGLQKFSVHLKNIFPVWLKSFRI